MPRGEQVILWRTAPSRISWAVGFRGKGKRTEEEKGKMGGTESRR